MRCSFFAALAILAGALLSAAAVRTELWFKQLPFQNHLNFRVKQFKDGNAATVVLNHGTEMRASKSISTADEEGSERSFQMKRSVSSLDNKPVAKIIADNSVSDFFDGTATPHAFGRTRAFHLNDI